MLITELHRLAALPPAQAIGRLERLLAAAEALRPGELLGYQLNQLERLLAFASVNVAHYRQSLRGLAGLSPGALRLERFRELPILRRADLQEREAELLAANCAPEDAPVGGTSTSGSTGRPISVPSSRVLGTLGIAQELRFHRWNRRSFDARAAVIAAPHPPGVADPPLGRSGRQWSVRKPSPAVELTLRAPISQQLDWLERAAPEYLISYPSNVMALARLSLERGVRLPELREVTVSSEPVSPELRALVDEAWSARLVATYSANEVGGIALQAPGSDDYLVQSEYLLVEILKDDGSPCTPGEVGRVVVTALHNFHRPLIRYEVGDYAEVGDEPHGELLLPRLRRVMGRERNMVRLPGGDQVWPFFELGELVKLKALRQWQMIQRSEQEIEARLVCDRPLTPEEETLVKRTITACLPVSFEVTLRFVTEIARGARGKYEEFINATLGAAPSPGDSST